MGPAAAGGREGASWRDPGAAQVHVRRLLDSTFWSLRGKLDVPKERFISYPHAERDADQTPGHRLGRMGPPAAGEGAGRVLRAHEGAGRLGAGAPQAAPRRPARTDPLAEAVAQRARPGYGIGMGDYFAGFVDEEARALGFTLDDVRAWQPPARNSRRRRRASV